MVNPEIQNVKVMIIGGGIGGFATATALQYHGIEAHIYEQAEEIREIGAGIIIHPPTQHLFEKWGLKEQFQKVARANETIELYTAQGDFITTIGDDILSSLEKDQQNIHPASIRRTDLLNLLASSIDPAFIHLNHKYESLVEKDDYVEVTFTNGTVVRAELVIAANGIHSKIRKMFSDDEPIYSGFHSVRTILPLEAVKETAKENGTVMYKDEATLLLMQPVADGMHFDIGYPSQDPSWVKDVTKEEVAHIISIFDEKLVKLLDAIEEPIVSRGLYFRQPIEKWSTKRLTLLGDAAHSMLPTLGQGAKSAIAYPDAIARALVACDTVQVAIQQYETERRPITTAMQNESQKFEKALDI